MIPGHCRFRPRSPHHLPHPNQEHRRSHCQHIFTPYRHAPTDAQNCIDFLINQAAVEASEAVSKVARRVTRLVKGRLVDLSDFVRSGLRLVAVFARRSCLRFKFLMKDHDLTQVLTVELDPGEWAMA